MPQASCRSHGVELAGDWLTTAVIPSQVPRQFLELQGSSMSGDAGGDAWEQ